MHVSCEHQRVKVRVDNQPNYQVCPVVEQITYKKISNLSCDLINLVVEEVALFVKVLIPQSATSDHAIGNAASGFHHQAQHLVVGLAWEEDAAQISKS